MELLLLCPPRLPLSSALSLSLSEQKRALCTVGCAVLVTATAGLLAAAAQVDGAGEDVVADEEEAVVVVLLLAALLMLLAKLCGVTTTERRLTVEAVTDWPDAGG